MLSSRGTPYKSFNGREGTPGHYFTTIYSKDMICGTISRAYIYIWQDKFNINKFVWGGERHCLILKRAKVLSIGVILTTPEPYFHTTITNGRELMIYSAPPLFATPLICHPHLSPTICQSPIRHHVISPFNLPPAPSHFANQSHAQTVHFAIEIPHYFANQPLCTNFS